MRCRTVAVSLCACVATLAAPVAVQGQSQRQAEVHANHSRGTTSKADALGAGAQVQLVWGASRALAKLGTSLGADWTKQEAGGPNQWNASLDAVVQVGGSGSVTPYAGGSVGANWSTGDGAQWSGARLGLESIGGVQVKLGAGSSAPSLKAEERFGYVRGQEHTLATRLGIQFSL